MRKKVLIVAFAVVVLVLAGVAVAAYLRATETPDAGIDTELAGVSVMTATEELPTTTEEQPVEEPEEPEAKAEGPCWLSFGGNPQRTLARENIDLGRPTRAVWGRAIGFMEYPATFCDGTLYVNNAKGTTFAIDAETGDLVWKRKVASLMASSPAIAGPRLIVSSHDGTVTGLNRANGKVLWRVGTAGRVESSPVAVDNTAYFGSTDGRLFAVNVTSGAVRWAYDTGGGSTRARRSGETVSASRPTPARSSACGAPTATSSGRRM